MNPDQAVSSLPLSPGIYLLHLQLSQACVLHIGSLGDFVFPAGEYVYCGSAFGPGGLRARLGRHLRGTGKPHWHIDALRAAADLKGFCFCEALTAERVNGPASTRLECLWSQKLTTLPGVCIPVPGFGSSDCRAGCCAHLASFPFHNGSILADLVRSGALIVDGVRLKLHFHRLAPRFR